jgi:hypothetical protein
MKNSNASVSVKPALFVMEPNPKPVLSIDSIIKRKQKAEKP